MKKILITLGVLVLLAGAYFLFGMGEEEAPETETTQEDMMQEETSENEEMETAEESMDSEMMDEGEIVEDTMPTDEEEDAMDEMMEEDTNGEGDTGTEDTPVQLRTFEVDGSNHSFSVEEMVVNEGDTVRVVFTNSEGFHDWTIDEFAASTEVISEGEQDTVEFVADQTGTFEYYCSVGNHRAMGMVGTLIVE